MTSRRVHIRRGWFRPSFLSLVVLVMVLLAIWLFAGSHDDEAWSEITSPAWSHHAVRTVLVQDDALYVGLAAAYEGAAQVWRLSQQGWQQIGGSGQGWEGFQSVSGLIEHESKIYAALGYTGGRVYRLSNGEWEHVGGEGLGGSWTSADYEWPYDFAVFDGALHAGLRNNKSCNGAAVFRLNKNDTWTKLRHWNDVCGAYSLLSTELALFVGLDGKDVAPSAAQVWRYNKSDWAKIGGNGLNGSWDFAGYGYVESLAVYRGQIVASIGRPPSTGVHGVWAFDQESSQWEPLGQAPAAWADFHIFNHLLVLDGYLFLGAGGQTHQKSAFASVWRYDGEEWELIGGKGLNGSWNSPLENADGNTEWVYRLAIWKSRLVAAVAGGHTGAALWYFQLDAE